MSAGIGSRNVTRMTVPLAFREISLIAAEAQHITPVIALNKRDLTVLFAHALTRLSPYVDMGYTVLSLALKSGDLGDLPERLAKK